VSHPYTITIFCVVAFFTIGNFDPSCDTPKLTDSTLIRDVKLTNPWR